MQNYIHGSVGKIRKQEKSHTLTYCCWYQIGMKGFDSWKSLKYNLNIINQVGQLVWISAALQVEIIMHDWHISYFHMRNMFVSLGANSMVIGGSLYTVFYTLLIIVNIPTKFIFCSTSSLCYVTYIIYAEQFMFYMF